jgi:SAM-dependent methyltransferase
MATWQDVVAKLKGAGISVVQVGQREDTLIAGIDYDLRGRTSLAEAAVVLKYAACHLDTEGGLVHLARAVHGRSVVAFGPTPAEFFGYPQNVNLVPASCGDCWWTTTDWIHQCPRRTLGPECMSGHSAATIVEHAMRIISDKREPRCEVVSAGLFTRSSMQELQDVSAKIHEASGLSFDGLDRDAVDSKTALEIPALKIWGYCFIVQQLRTAEIHLADLRIADIGGGCGALGYAFGVLGARVEAFDETFASPNGANSEYRFVSHFSSVGRAIFGSAFNLPAEDETCDIVICNGAIDRRSYSKYAFRELLRVLRPGGLLFFNFVLAPAGAAITAQSEDQEAAAIDPTALAAMLSQAGAGPCPFTDEQCRASAIESEQARIYGVARGTTLGVLGLRKLDKKHPSAELLRERTEQA